MPASHCKQIGKMAWKWIQPELRQRLKAKMAKKKISAKEAARKMGVGEEDVTQWIDSEKEAEKALKEHVKKVMVFIEAVSNQGVGSKRSASPAVAHGSAKRKK